MKQFNKAEAKRIFEQYPEANYVAQDADGDVDGYLEEPVKELRKGWVGKGVQCIDSYAQHPDGWENSLYSRADVEGE